MEHDTTSEPPVSRRWTRHATLLRVALIVLVLATAWWLVLEAASREVPYLLDVSTSLVVVALTVLTVLWGMSIRSRALRRALLPIEAGTLVAALIALFGYGTGHGNVDTAFLGMLFAAGTAALVAFLQLLLLERRSTPWIASVVALAAVAGAGLLALDGGFQGDE